MNFQTIGGHRTAKTSSNWDYLANTLLPQGKQERQKRLKQYKDASLFFLSIALVTLLEKQVTKLLQLDKSELAQFTTIQSQMHHSY